MLPYFSFEKIVLGSMTFYVWGILASIAFVASLFVALKEAKRKNIDRDKIISLSIIIVASGFLGARIFYFALFWNYFSDHLSEIFYFWKGGQVLYGGVFFAFLFGYFYIKKSKLSFLQIADVVALPAALGIFIGRIGCVLINDHIGSLTKLPWAMEYLDKSLRHPVSIYLSLNGLILFFVLWFLKKKIARRGILFSLFLLYYSATRFFLDFFRCQDLDVCDPRFYNLTISQWISIAIFALTLIWVLWYDKNRLKF
jgi:phosphatidylglycerol:prolipoprotein diacylglycerol transferase